MDYILYGIGTRYVYEVNEIIWRQNNNVKAYIHNMEALPPPAALDPIINASEISAELLDMPVIIPLVTPGHRKLLEPETLAHGFSQFADLFDPTSIIASSSQFDTAANVNAGVVIGANCTFGRSCLVNRSASIGHDAVVEDYVTFGPGCVICGSCYIESGVFIGAGAVISPKIHIGRNSIIGAGAVVVRDVAENCTVAGNPAKIIKENTTGYNNSSV